jgi:hypothetical protein
VLRLDLLDNVTDRQLASAAPVRTTVSGVPQP